MASISYTQQLLHTVRSGLFRCLTWEAQEPSSYRGEHSQLQRGGNNEQMKQTVGDVALPTKPSIS